MNSTLQEHFSPPVSPQESERARASDFPDLAEWEQRPGTQIVTEKCAASSPYLGGSARKPRNIRTLRRWRQTLPRRGPAYLKIGGRYYYTVQALREFHRRSVRGDSI